MKQVLQQIGEAIRDHPLRRFVAEDDHHRSDWVSPVAMAMLSAVGLMFIYSAQSFYRGSAWKLQALWLLIGVIAYRLVSAVNYRIYLDLARWVYALSLILLVPVALQSLIYQIDAIPDFKVPLVKTQYGSTRWLDFGLIVLQPSEIAKLGTLLMASALLMQARLENAAEMIKVLIQVSLVSFIPWFLIFLQPDLGTALVIPPMILSLLYVCNLPQRIFSAILVAGVIGVGIIAADVFLYQAFMRENNLSFHADKGAWEAHSIVPLKDYQRNRIMTFVAPHIIDPKGIGDAWNLKQSLIAVAGGGLTGKGFTQGTQTRMGYLPRTVSTNDFIFAVIAEESGFVGCLVLIGLYGVLIINGMRIAALAKDRLGMMLATGTSVIFTMHVFVNMGMTYGIMPITGLPLPFVSYGGSFILTCCILQGIVQSVYRFRQDFS